MRIPLIAGNFKMFKTIGETMAYINDLRSLVKDVQGVDIVIAPPFTAIAAAANGVDGSNIGVSAQDMHWEREGAFTGEVSAGMLREAGARYVIIGHSERRTLFGEDDETVGKKARAVLDAGLRVIVCVGETEAERDGGRTEARVEAQMKAAMASIQVGDLDRLVVAYEPVWAIGTGRTATPAQAQEVHAFTRGLLRTRFGAPGEAVRIQYGGSVKPDNAAELMRQPDVDGALVGGASLKAEDFAGIVKAARPRAG